MSLDYFYITSKGMLERHELEFPRTSEGEARLNESRVKGETAKCILMRDLETKVIWAHVIPVKGVDEERHVVNLVCEDIEWLGHTAIILKSDNEPSILTLLNDSLKAARVDVAWRVGEQRARPEHLLRAARLHHVEHELGEAAARLVAGARPRLVVGHGLGGLRAGRVGRGAVRSDVLSTPG